MIQSILKYVIEHNVNISPYLMICEKCRNGQSIYSIKLSYHGQILLDRFKREHIPDTRNPNIPSVAEWIDRLGNSSAKIKESERKGFAYASPREWEQVASRAEKEIKAKQDRIIREKTKFAVSEIKKGRKYTKEWSNKLEQLRNK